MENSKKEQNSPSSLSVSNLSDSTESMSDRLFDNLVNDLITSQFKKNPSLLNLDRKPKADKGV